MRHKRFRFSLAWITALVTGLLIAVANPAPALAEPGEWDPTLPAAVSAGAPGDPLAVANASLQATAQATQTTLNLGQQFLSGLGINLGGSAAPAADSSTGASRIPRANGRQAIEHVIRRAGSQMGVPYSWGGGSLDGPSKGVDSGAGINGFDCSGLMRYAFAGVGVLIPRFSGDQYTAGRHIPQNEARRGDLIFYGPNGGQHVTMYLGNGQMLEASSLAGKVTISPVRKPGMTPYLTRIIEY
ncbi:NlpC/P60 family protein [Mycobacterium paragordonae]|uniref:Peptidoglycan endopeptidase RipB n=1 Tax=Mycobacterium paragordonae TaxID=1389713 RepID=A0A386U4U9_9MYCO|nr:MULTISPECIES: NlpC/P60 family peptidoglycan endopeptidase RipB [Mycobacterium]PJE22438.1 MAG: NlpC/P60 family protein [Mycobacterium sp.]AYE95563.1 NlpC/P60 family protein [Mycobacterium paragordonae]MDP7735403.1 NlpC/P60 family peptidoglycan endopeptidase RipB [Mycobacterium paragordonae]OBJ79410.1 peptidase C40 [Mycobacterium gordonae]OBK50506.1 peptidase C40 [Mycobacterium gordonae]